MKLKLLMQFGIVQNKATRLPNDDVRCENFYLGSKLFRIKQPVFHCLFETKKLDIVLMTLNNIDTVWNRQNVILA